MQQTITAMYASRNDAERVADQLRTMGLSDVDLHSDAQSGTIVTASGHTSGGLWSDIKSLFTGDDRLTYEEGIRRGRTLLTVRTDDAHADRVVDLLDRTEALDVDAETETYRADGWRGEHDPMADDRARFADDRTVRSDSRRDFADDRSRADDDRIELAEEQLSVGKRDTVRNARVRTYVVETPVEEQVHLREEHVRVDRTPVRDGELSEADADRLFQDRTIEVSEHSEEAVVGKRAVVTEELRVSKDVGERVETVRDTVRHTEVDVDGLEDAGVDRSTRR